MLGYAQPRHPVVSTEGPAIFGEAESTPTTPVAVDSTACHQQ
jgi:hypothetical protein